MISDPDAPDFRYPRRGERYYHQHWNQWCTVLDNAAPADSQARDEILVRFDGKSAIVKLKSLVPGPIGRPGVAAVRVELMRALEYWRWCWDCGTTDRHCRALGRPCCPDCRHRDTGNPALIELLYGEDQ